MAHATVDGYSPVTSPTVAPVPPSGHKRYAQVVAGVLSIGLGWAVYTLASAGAAADSYSLAAWSDGSAGRMLDSRLRLPGQSRIDTTLAAVRYRVWGDLGPQVTQGCSGWLFYKDGLNPLRGTDAQAAFTERLRLMRAWTAMLQASGVSVLVVPVPDKSRIQASQLCGLTYSQPMRDRLDVFERALRESRIPFVDLRAPLASVHAAFFRTDVHMNQRGAAQAAHIVSTAALGSLGKKGEQRYTVTQASAPTARVGDLLVLAGLGDAADGWRPAPDMERVETITPVRSGSLLDDTPPAEVLLAGSSNGRRSQFAERLGQGLGREVWNMSMDGGQYAGALMTAIEQRKAWPASVKLVIWEFSEMSLSLPLTEAEKRALAQLD